MEAPKRIIDERTGRLAESTRLDPNFCSNFMRVTDMRRDIVIADSNLPSDDSFNAHSFDKEPDQMLVTIHQPVVERRLINRFGQQVLADDNVYQKFYTDALKDGLTECLFTEKLGLADQWTSYGFYPLFLMSDLQFFMPLLKSAGEFDPAIVYATVAALTVAEVALIDQPFAHAVIKVGRAISREIRETFAFNYRKSWRELPLPVLPVDRYIRGRLFIIQHGNQLLIPSD